MEAVIEVDMYFVSTDKHPLRIQQESVLAAAIWILYSRKTIEFLLFSLATDLGISVTSIILSITELFMRTEKDPVINYLEHYRTVTENKRGSKPLVRMLQSSYEKERLIRTEVSSHSRLWIGFIYFSCGTLI